MVSTLSTADAAIRDASQRRLKKLELQAARQGDNAPAEILVEIEKIREKLGLSAAPATEDERYERLELFVNGVALIVEETRQDVQRLLWRMPLYMFALVLLIIVLVKL